MKVIGPSSPQRSRLCRSRKRSGVAMRLILLSSQDWKKRECVRHSKPSRALSFGGSISISPAFPRLWRKCPRLWPTMGARAKKPGRPRLRVCLRRPISERGWRNLGSIRRATQIQTATRSMAVGTCGSGGTGSFRPTTRTNRLISLRSSRLPGTSSPMRAIPSVSRQGLIAIT